MDDFSQDCFMFSQNAGHQDNLVSSKVETKKFIQVLTEQVKLDEQFRLTKNWFVNSDISD